MGKATGQKRGRGARLAIGAVLATALLAALPAVNAGAQQKSDPAPPAPAQPAPAPVDDAPPVQVVVRRVEIYGTMMSRAGKVATMLTLVMTSPAPPSPGSKGLLLRRVETKGSNAITWLEIADVMLKKELPGGKMQFDIVAERPSTLVNGKKTNHFLKGTKVKVQIDE
jgi:hypothetical protein